MTALFFLAMLHLAAGAGVTPRLNGAKDATRP
jgi:hypothetical protein